MDRSTPLRDARRVYTLGMTRLLAALALAAVSAAPSAAAVASARVQLAPSGFAASAPAAASLAPAALSAPNVVPLFAPSASVAAPISAMPAAAAPAFAPAALLPAPLSTLPSRLAAVPVPAAAAPVPASAEGDLAPAPRSKSGPRLAASSDAGASFRAALTAVKAGPDGFSVLLDGTPTRDALRAVGATDGLLLSRRTADGRWRLTKAGAPGLSAAPLDADFSILGRPTAGRPAAADLASTEGRVGRFAIASPKGVHEWNSDMPRGAAAALDTPWGRLLARAAGPLYRRLLAAFGVASEKRAWEKVAPEWLSAAAPVDARHMAETVIPAWMAEELPVTAAKLGLSLSDERRADILERSKVWVYKWHSGMTYEIGGGLPDGHYDPKFGIRVMLKLNWRALKDPQAHFKVLFAHEYTHWLQNEGLVTRRYGIEIPAVAVEQLRAMELVGWEGMKGRKVGFIADGNLDSFENGREWARGDMSDETALVFRGVLGGVAYEVGRIAGRPEAAWEFLNLVIAEKGGMKARDAYERVTGSKPGAAR